MIPVTMDPSDRPSRTPPLLLALLAVVCLGLSVAAVAVPVHVPREGDGIAFTCSSIARGDETVAGECDRRVIGRLQLAALAGTGAGVFGLLAFLTERQLRR